MVGVGGTIDVYSREEGGDGERMQSNIAKGLPVQRVHVKCLAKAMEVRANFSKSEGGEGLSVCHKSRKRVECNK